MPARQKTAPAPPRPSVGGNQTFLAADLVRQKQPTQTFSAPESLRPEVSKTAAPRNQQIPFEVVQMPDPATGALGPPERLADLLARINLKKEYLTLLNDDPPVVKLVTFEEERRLDKVRKDQRKAQRATTKGEKEVQITWKAEPADLEHKVDKIKEMLSKGGRVSVLLTTKPNALPPGDERRAQMERSIYNAVEDLAVESRQQQRGRRYTVMFFKPKITSS
ncbi:hypothetical protein CALVIDRAFT_538653 [Calocera viscosa TUFC12733]|uniref:Translation initiation factor IF-3 n=1 Tax=Calocera viscosa (strain TUFC12733) TaxID=1330018 RepID=A0A167KQ22_CALVF|nr:hypothetical protein CALVIDRAFT_538653 [Calocera viscosa TUFC12733]